MDEESGGIQMSELKSYIGPHPSEYTLTEFYLKSEADKVIAELKDAVKYNFEQFYNERKLLRHHKYKRCLDKAKWCESEEKRLDAIAPIFDNDKECWEYGSDYWNKWRQRWLELAEKFKEAK